MRAEYDCYAITPPGIEQVTARELAVLGVAAGDVELGGVAFRATKVGLYGANLELRSASRVLVRVASFHAAAFHELERRAGRLPWHRFLAPGAVAEFRVTSRKSKLYHGDAVEERLARIVETGRERARTGENVATQLFVVRLYGDECTISIDSSGELLHRRGYRLAGGEAPLREILAAVMLLESGWDGTTALADPFCGSGTIPTEAALIARRRAPGLERAFAFEHWPELDALGWKRLKDAARSRVLERAPAAIVGADRDAGAVAAAAANVERAGVAGDVELRRATMSAFEPPEPTGHLVTNPPYGVRVGERAKLRGLYVQLGTVIQTRCPRWRVTLLSPDRSLEHATGLRFESRLVTTNGGIKVRLIRTPS
jgi:putative N6-adenine-specific DNA methylase